MIKDKLKIINSQINNRINAKHTVLLIFLLLIFNLFALSQAVADSLYKDGVSSPYTTEKSFKVGDIITILVIESTSAIHKAGTNTDVRDDFSAKLDHSISRLTTLVPASNSLTGEERNKYTGSGKTERSSSLKTKIAVVVTEILSNGNLRVSGKHNVAVNEDNQEVQVSGIIRSKDVSIANTVYSYQVADADIQVKGTGVIQEAESPGWLTRFFNWLF